MVMMTMMMMATTMMRIMMTTKVITTEWKVRQQDLQLSILDPTVSTTILLLIPYIFPIIFRATILMREDSVCFGAICWHGIL